jgi:hypothetical protein
MNTPLVTTDTLCALATSVPTTGPLACPRCGAVDHPVVTPYTGKVHAFVAHCGRCGAHLKFVSRYAPAARMARREQWRRQAMAARPPSAAQLAYLVALGDQQPTPETMQDASDRIEQRLALVRGQKNSPVGKHGARKDGNNAI